MYLLIDSGGEIMKLINRIICIVGIIGMILTNNAFAGEQITVEKLIINDSIGSSVEKIEVLESVDKSFVKLQKRLQKVIDKKKTETNQTLYKVYFPNEIDIIGKYKETNNFEKLISSEYMWEGAIYTESGEIASMYNVIKGPKVDNDVLMNLSKEEQNEIKKLEGKWYVNHIGNNIPINSVKVISDKNKINDMLFNEGLSGISSIKLVTLPAFHTYVLFVKSKNDEYGVPFTTREDLVGLTNGKVYKISEVINTLENRFNNPSIDSNEDIYGGGFVEKNIEHSYKNSIIAVLTIIVLCSIRLIVRKNRYKTIGQ